MKKIRRKNNNLGKTYKNEEKIVPIKFFSAIVEKSKVNSHFKVRIEKSILTPK